MWKTWIGASILSLSLVAVGQQGGSTSVEMSGGPATQTSAAKRFEKLTDAQIIEKADKLINRMRKDYTKVLSLLTEAREQRDIVKLNAVNDSLTQIKGLLRAAEASNVKLQEALANKDRAGAIQALEMIVSAQLSIEGFVRESQAAIGELSMYAGDTQLTVEVDNQVLSTTSEGAAGPGVVVAESGAESEEEVDTSEPDLQGEVLAEEGGVPEFDGAIDGDGEAAASDESDSSEETEVSEPVTDITVPPPVSGFQ